MFSLNLSLLLGVSCDGKEIMAGSWPFITVSVLADPGLWFYKSLPSCVFCGDKQKGSSRQRGVLNGVGPFYDSHMSQRTIL